jgi:molecular chaperone GrpE
MLPKEPQENESNEPEKEASETESPAVLEEELAAEKQKADEYLANWQRVQADFINFKRRTEEERAEFNSYANANLVLAILPVLDDLERALDSVPLKHKKSEWVEGVRLVAHKFKTILEGQGVKPIKAMGEAFDPNYHEALRQDKGKEGMVIEEFQKGYLIHEKLLRPARVVVGNGEADTKEEV